MKRKIYLGMLTLISMLFATSCSQDEMINDPSTGDFVNATFTISTADALGTRAIGDGTTVDKVACAVYEADDEANELKELYKVEDIVGQKATYNVRLVKGKNYRVAFFAYNEGAAAYNVKNLKNIIVNEDQLSNVEGRDAFTAYVDVEEGETMNAFTKDVTLKRPFAQLNLGIDDDELTDAANAGLVVAKSKIVVSNVYKAFSAFDNAVVGNTSEMTFKMNAIPTEKLVVDGAEYNYLAMNYLLVGDNDGSEKTLTDVEFIWQTENDETNNPTTKFFNIPVQRNYRTNIIGKLLTSPATFNIVIDETFTNENGEPNPDHNVYIAVQTVEQLKNVFEKGGNAVLENDIELEKITAIEPGAEVYLNLNGKTVTVDENTASNTLMYVKEGAKLTIDGDGIIDLGEVSTMAVFAPYGELVINNGTFIRSKVTTVTDKTTGLFMGAKTTSSNVTINGGYFDAGYYDANAADIEALLAGTKTLEETADDIAKRNNSKDANKVRVALKENVSAVLNHSGYGSFKIYGGTFVGANPAWGDEGCMLPTTPNYLRPWSYYQGALLDGQEFNESGIVLPTGYSITKGTTEDGIPTYTVSYSK